MNKLSIALLLVLASCAAPTAVPTPEPSAVIDSFESCAMKYPVMESYPRQCVTPDGARFVETISFESGTAGTGALTEEMPIAVKKGTTQILQFDTRLVQIELPASFTVTVNPESGRRGAFASYNLTSAGPLNELQLFSAESIAVCEAREKKDGLCFEGEHPTSASFEQLSREYGKDIKGYERMLIGERDMYVKTYQVKTDIGFLRSYSTVVGTTQVDVYAYLPEDDETSRTAADEMVKNIVISYTGY